MTRLRCAHLSITAPWWSAKKPRNWGFPANDDFEPGSVQWDSWLVQIHGYTPTGGKR